MKEMEFWQENVMKLNASMINLHGIHNWVPLENLIEIPEGLNLYDLASIAKNDGCASMITKTRTDEYMSVFIN